MKPATSNLASHWGLPRPVIKFHAKKWAWPWLKELHKILEFPLNIFATAQASDFKFGTKFGFSKAHHKITPSEKGGVALG